MTWIDTPHPIDNFRFTPQTTKAETLMSLSAADYDYIRKLVRDRSAIVLEAGKEYLIESRLLPLARQEGFGTINNFVLELRSARPNGLHDKVIDAMTTNETSFFRDIHPFEALKQVVIPELLAKRANVRALNIWSAACSSGQESYSILMLLRENFPQLATWDVRLHATDISKEMLERTRSGEYNPHEISRGLPAPLLAKYFQKSANGWQAKEDLRRMITTRELNLSQPWAGMPPMDLIFIRNVLIYFDTETKKAILGRARRSMRPDGYLFLGTAETTINIDDEFDRAQFERVTYYKLRDAQKTPAACLPRA